MKSRILLAIVATLVALAGCELAVRLVAPQDLAIFTITRDGLIVHPPDLDVYSYEHGQTVETNSLGMRDHEHPPKPEDDVYRVLLLGDSFMEALQVSFEHSLPSLLERKLKDATKRPVEVVNASVSGWGTDDQVAYLKRYGLRLEPDLVLIGMTLHNDVSDNLRRTFHELRDGALHEKAREEIPLVRYSLLRARIFLASNSHLYQLARRAWLAKERREKAARLNRHVAQLLRRDPNERTREGWTLTYRLLEETKRLAGREGARLAVFLIPLSLQVSEEELETFVERHGLDRSEIDLDAPQQAMTRWGSGREVPVIDLLPAFRRHARREEQALYLESDGHWTEEGHRLGAERVARELVARDLVKSPEPAGRAGRDRDAPSEADRAERGSLRPRSVERPDRIPVPPDDSGSTRAWKRVPGPVESEARTASGFFLARSGARR